MRNLVGLSLIVGALAVTACTEAEGTTPAVEQPTLTVPETVPAEDGSVPEEEASEELLTGDPTSH